jgi:hypothetical protein
MKKIKIKRNYLKEKEIENSYKNKILIVSVIFFILFIFIIFSIVSSSYNFFIKDYDVSFSNPEVDNFKDMIRKELHLFLQQKEENQLDSINLIFEYNITSDINKIMILDTNTLDFFNFDYNLLSLNNSFEIFLLRDLYSQNNNNFSFFLIIDNDDNVLDYWFENNIVFSDPFICIMNQDSIFFNLTLINDSFNIHSEGLCYLDIKSKINEKIDNYKLENNCYYIIEGSEPVYSKGIYGLKNNISFIKDNYCIDSYHLQYFYCSNYYDTKIFLDDVFYCESGCKDSVCVTENLLCIDEGTKDEFKRGMVRIFKDDKFITNYIDSCIDEYKLKKWSCQDNLQKANIIICLNGCEKGVCLKNEKIKIEIVSEKKNYCIKSIDNDYERGFVSGIFESNISFIFGDECIDNNTLFKWYCNDSIPINKTINCDNFCYNDRCIINTTISCIDSDEKDFETKGFVSGINKSYDYYYYVDRCLDDKKLLEYSCNNNSLEIIEYECPHSCKDGKCILNTVCFDEDNGAEDQIFVKSKVSGINDNNYPFYFSDNCLNEEVLEEWACNGLYPFSFNKQCSHGCENGRCIRYEKNINFQRKEDKVPYDYFSDYGELFNNERGYGWSTENIGYNDQDIYDARMSSFIIFSHNSEWKISLKSGYYSIYVVFKDPLIEGSYDFFINNKNVFTREVDFDKLFFHYSDIVHVTDGFIRLKVNSSDFETNRICFINILEIDV